LAFNTVSKKNLQLRALVGIAVVAVLIVLRVFFVGDDRKPMTEQQVQEVMKTYVLTPEKTKFLADMVAAEKGQKLPTLSPPQKKEEAAKPPEIPEIPQKETPVTVTLPSGDLNKIKMEPPSTENLKEISGLYAYIQVNNRVLKIDIDTVNGVVELGSLNQKLHKKKNVQLLIDIQKPMIEICLMKSGSSYRFQSPSPDQETNSCVYLGQAVEIKDVSKNIGLKVSKIRFTTGPDYSIDHLSEQNQKHMEMILKIKKKKTESHLELQHRAQHV